MGLLEAQGKEKTFFKSSSKKFQLIGKENKAAGKAMNVGETGEAWRQSYERLTSLYQ